MNTFRLIELLSFCDKAKIVKNMADGKMMTDIDALNYYGSTKAVECVSYNSLKREIIINTNI